jgi:hypothetical protein
MAKKIYSQKPSTGTTSTGATQSKSKTKITIKPGRRSAFKPSDFKKTGKLHPLAQINAKRKKAVINGQRFDKGDSNLPYLVEKGTALLKRAGFAKFSQTGGTEASALDFLFHIGCVVSQEPADYSLADDNFDPSLDTEVVENENIVDIPAFQKITNKNILVTDKFSLVDDPFFRLDGDEYGGIPENILRDRQGLLEKRIKGALEVAAAYSAINTNKNRRSDHLKAFKKVTHIV